MLSPVTFVLFLDQCIGIVHALGKSPCSARYKKTEEIERNGRKLKDLRIIVAESEAFNLWHFLTLVARNFRKDILFFSRSNFSFRENKVDYSYCAMRLSRKCIFSCCLKSVFMSKKYTACEDNSILNIGVRKLFSLPFTAKKFFKIVKEFDTGIEMHFQLIFFWRAGECCECWTSFD